MLAGEKHVNFGAHQCAHGSCSLLTLISMLPFSRLAAPGGWNLSIAPVAGDESASQGAVVRQLCGIAFRTQAPLRSTPLPRDLCGRGLVKKILQSILNSSMCTTLAGRTLHIFRYPQRIPP